MKILTFTILICICVVFAQRTQAQLNFEELNVPNNGLTINAIAMTTERNGVTVGDFGTILSTSNGFASWEVVQTGTKKEFLAVAFFDSTIGIAVGADGILYRTTNAGTSWQSQSSGVKDTLRSIAILGNRAIIVGSNGTILETKDKGISYTKRQSSYSGSLNSIKFRGANNGIIVGDNGLILRSDNGGQTWNKVFSDSSIYSFISSVDWVDDTTVIAVGYYGFIARSIDGGISWQKYYTAVPPIAGGHFKCIYFLNSSVGFIGGSFRTASYPSASVLWTNDGGMSWKTQDSITSLTIKERTTLPVIFSFIAVSSDKIFAVGSDFNEDKTPMICSSEDGGVHWKFNLYERNGFINIYDSNNKKHTLATGYHDISFVDNLTGYVVGFGGKIVKTTDGGDSWRDVSSGTQRRLRRLTIYDKNTVAVVGDTGLVLVSTNAGQSWNEYYPLGDSSSLLSIGFRACTFSDNRTIWISDYNFRLPLAETGFVLRSKDNGKTWENIKIANTDNDRYFSIVFKSPLKGWMCGYRRMATESRIPLLLYTEDGGESWQEQSLPPFKAGEYFSSINTVMVFTDTLHGSIPITGSNSDTNLLQTYFHTTDGGRTWLRHEPYNYALPPLSMYKGSLADISFADENHGVIIAKFNVIDETNLHYTDNAGAAWKVADYSIDSRIFSRGFYKLAYPTPKRCWILGLPFRIFRLTLPEISNVEYESQNDSESMFYTSNGSIKIPILKQMNVETLSISVSDIMGRRIENHATYQITREQLVVQFEGGTLPIGIYYIEIRGGGYRKAVPVIIAR